MDFNLSQSLQLKQSLKLNQHLIQRFNILEQSLDQFETSMEDKAKKNPYISFKRFSSGSIASNIDGDDYVSPLEFATYDESLLSKLTTQLDAQQLSDVDNEIVLTLIDHLDDKGYLLDYKGIREQLKNLYNVDDRRVFQCLKVLQSFEPDGVGARSLSECLWIQIENYGVDDPDDAQWLKLLVKNHLEDISNKNYDGILQALAIDRDQLVDFIDFISHLNSNPASQYAQGDIVQIQPSLRIDVKDEVITLVNLEESRMSVHLNDDLLNAMDKTMTAQEKKKLAEAKVWVEHFKKRQELLLRCGEYLIQKQRLYFLEGEAFVLPCLQRDLATALGVSESTISRLVRTKYIQCSHGVILIKNLCQRNIYGKTKSQVKHLVAYYCQRYPQLSDNKIAYLLAQIGLPIARRTVTKYRHESNLDSSYDRKPN